VNYRAEWHPGDGAPFLGPGRFVKKIAQESIPPPSSRRITLKDLLKSAAAKSGLSAEILLRKGRLGRVVNARDRFVRDAVLQHGYLACQVASFLNCHSIQCQSCTAKKLIDLGKSVTIGLCHHWGPLGSANFIREIRVVRLMPNRSAPPTRPLLCEVGSGSHLGVKAEFRAFIKSFRPMQRMGIPDDVANVAEYLAGDPAAFASGQHLLVAGGAPA
jgi:hypothetical protein